MNFQERASGAESGDNGATRVEVKWAIKNDGDRLVYLGEGRR